MRRGWHRKPHGWHHHHLHGRRRHPSLQKRIFFWFGATIVFTGLVVFGLMSALSPMGRWAEQQQSISRFVGSRLADSWDEPEERARFVRELSADFHLDATLRDEQSRLLVQEGGECREPWARIPVEREGVRLGTLAICVHAPSGGWWRPVLAILVALFIVWGASGLIARRLLRPMRNLQAMATRIGDGDLKARSGLCIPRDGELGLLGQTMDTMATRIEKQLADQRELLAAVSHELRTPLGHLRVLLDLAREAPSAAHLDEIEKETLEIDALVGQLLASSRLDFGTIERVPVDAVELAARALERAGLDPTKLEALEKPPPATGDPTLLARALSNLIRNAELHGKGLLRLTVERDRDRVRFAVEDAGPGIAKGEREKVFEAFYRGEHRAGGSLGLGLSLVRRIALAHGGEVHVEDRKGGGARVVLTIAPASSEGDGAPELSG